MLGARMFYNYANTKLRTHCGIRMPNRVGRGKPVTESEQELFLDYFVKESMVLREFRVFCNEIVSRNVSGDVISE